MIRIPDECQENARGMLAGRFSQMAAVVDKDCYFVVDGKLWCADYDGVIYRSDDQDETNRLLGLFRMVNSLAEQVRAHMRGAGL